MPRPKSPTGYPLVYAQVIEAVVSTQQPFTFERKDNKQAQLTRFQMYDFIKACRRSNLPREKELGEAAYGLIFSVKGANLTISLRDRAEEAVSMQEQLNEFLQKEELPVVAGKAASASFADSIPQAQEQSSAHDDMISKYLKGDKK